jgi:hypothetical protein
MTTTIDFPDLDAAIDAEAWQWLQEAAPVYADAVTAEVKRGPALALRLEQAARHLRRQRQEAGQ